MRRPVLAIVVLAAAASFFGWETYKAWTAGEARGDPPAEAVSPVSRPETATDNALRDGDLSVQVAVIVTKPLFRPDRQPFHENAAVAGRNYEAELARFSLVGVLLQGEARKGLVLSSAGGRQERWEVGAGDSLPGFTVKEVQADGLVLTADKREFLLPLYAGGPKGQPAGTLRTEIAPGIPGTQTPAGLRTPSQSPNINIPAAASPSPNVNVPAASAPSPNMPNPPAVAPLPALQAVPPPPVLTDDGRGTFPRRPRVYPYNR